MGNSFSFSHSGSNATMTYKGSSGSYTASVRCSSASYNYGVSSTESHSRLHRAFYPHRRTQGQFRLVVDCKTYQEFKQLMTWLRGYTDTLLTAGVGTGSVVPIMDVSVPSRNFRRLGILTAGIDDHDHVGSMVFSPELIFVALRDPQDAAIPLLALSSVSSFSGPQIDPGTTTAFYPVSVGSYKDAQLYDDPGTATNADLAYIQSTVVGSSTEGVKGAKIQ